MGMAKAARKAHGRRPRRSWAAVVDLSSVRAQRRRELAERRVRIAMDENRAALARLFSSGLIFTQKGARAGRDLLLAHQHLLRVVTLLDRLSQTGDVPAPKQAIEVDAIFGELDDLLEKTGQLTEKTGAMFRGRGE